MREASKDSVGSVLRDRSNNNECDDNQEQAEAWPISKIQPQKIKPCAVKLELDFIKYTRW